MLKPKEKLQITNASDLATSFHKNVWVCHFVNINGVIMRKLNVKKCPLRWLTRKQEAFYWMKNDFLQWRLLEGGYGKTDWKKTQFVKIKINPMTYISQRKEHNDLKIEAFNICTRIFSHSCLHVSFASYICK